MAAYNMECSRVGMAALVAAACQSCDMICRTKVTPQTCHYKGASTMSIAVIQLRVNDKFNVRIKEGIYFLYYWCVTESTLVSLDHKLGHYVTNWASCHFVQTRFSILHPIGVYESPNKVLCWLFTCYFLLTSLLC